MPNYQYACPECKFQFEKMVPMSQCADKQECPSCFRMSPREFVAVAVVSDSTLFNGERLGNVAGAVDGSLIGDHFEAMAKQAGVTTRGKQYMSGLARYPGDPQAWVSDRNDIVRVAKKRNLAVESLGLGMPTVKNEPEAPQGRGLSEKIVNAHVARMMAADPSMKRENAEAAVLDRYAPAGGKRIIKSRKKAKIPRPNIAKVGRHARGKLQA